MDSHTTRELLENIFVPNTPLHDGAVVIRGARLMAAGCLLPLTQNRNLSTELGTRHRAAIGLSEQTDVEEGPERRGGFSKMGKPWRKKFYCW